MKKRKKGKLRHNKSKNRSSKAGKPKLRTHATSELVSPARAPARYSVEYPSSIVSPREFRQMPAFARGSLARARTELITETAALSIRCGIRPLHSPDKRPFIAVVESIPADATAFSALRVVCTVINCSRQIEDFSPAQVQTLAAHIRRWATPQSIADLPWDFAVVLSEKLVYALLAYEAERTDADWELAEFCARYALSLMEKHAPDDRHHSNAIDQLGTVLLNRRNTNRVPRLREAETHFQKNLELAPRYKNFHQQKRALLNLGILNHELARQEPGRLLRAIEYFDELEELNERLEPEERIRKQVLTNRGWARIELPRDLQPNDGCRKATADLQQAVAMCRQGLHNASALAFALMHLGLAQSQLDEYDHDQHEAALRSFQEAQTLFKGLGNQDGYSRMMHNLGLHWMHIGEPKKALAHYFEALRFRRGRAIEEWETFRNIIDVRIQPDLPPFGTEDSDDALLARIDQLVEQLAGHGDAERVLRAHYYGLQLLGHASSTENTDEALVRWAERAIQQAESAWKSAANPLSRYHLGRWLGTFYATRMLLGARRGESPDALLRFAQNGKARTLLLDRQSSSTKVPWLVDRKTLADRLQRSPDTAFIEIGISALGTAALVAYKGNEGDLALESRVLDVREQELVGLLQKPDRGWLWLIEALRVAVGQDQLEKLEACATGMERILGILYDRLLGPVTTGLRARGIRDLVFAVHGPLAALPLAAAWRIVDGEVRYLIEDFRSISLTPSVTSFVYSEHPRALARCRYVIGNTHKLPKEALRDGHQLEAAWQRSGQSVPLLKNPTPEEFLQSLEQVDLVHAVCHGLFDPWRLEASGIQVGGDELLSCERLLSDPEPKRAAMVILCACRSGRSRTEDFGGEWLGLSGIFLRRGVQAVLAALWDVDYGATFHLSRAFYDRLCVQNQPAAIAASEAMRVILDEGRSAKRNGEPHWFLEGHPVNLVPRLRRLLDSPWLWAGMQLVSTIPSMPS